MSTVIGAAARALVVGALIAAWPALATSETSGGKPDYAPPGAWVKLLPIPQAGAGAAAAGASEILLEDTQIRFAPDKDQFFDERAVKILTPEGLANVGTLEESWNPETENLTINRLRIVRGDKVIDLLAGGKTFTVLRRETKLELAMLDGTLTAAFQPEGLQVGDVLDFAVTFDRHDPIWRGLSEGASEASGPGLIRHFHLSAIWPQGKPIRWQTGDGLGAAQISRGPSGADLEIDRQDFTPAKVPQGAPLRFGHPSRITFSEFADWSQASALMAPLFDKAATLAADSPVKGEIARIAALSTDPKVRAAEALHLVQEKVRYLFLGMDLGGYVPAAADVTWERRFGDCKGKTVLLLALLHGLGVEAQPALVSTTFGDELADLPARLRVFDHVIVRATIAGKVYWLDGTRRGDRAIDDIPAPGFRWSLPLQARGAKLTPIDQPPFALPQAETITSIDMTAGVDAPAAVHAELLARGDAAIGLHISTETLSAADTDRLLRAGFIKSYPWVSVDKVAVAWDEAAGQTRLTMDGTGTAPWSRFPGGRQLHLIGSQAGGQISFARQPGPHQDAPFAVNYPGYTLNRTIVKLPDRGLSFVLAGAGDLDQTIAGFALHRHTQMTAGVVTMENSMRSVAREFPAADAPAAAAGLQQMGLRDAWISGPEVVSNGFASRASHAPLYPAVIGAPPAGGPRPGPIFIPASPTAPVPALLATPTLAPIALVRARDMAAPHTALALLQRARAWNREGEPRRAIDDLTAARGLEPRNIPVLAALAQMQAAGGDLDGARATLDAALAIDPKDPLLWVRRGAVRLAAKDAAGGADIDHGVDIGPDGPQTMAVAGRALMGLGLWEPAIVYFDQAVAAFPTDPSLGAMLGARCLARSQWGRRLDRAARDCQTALTLAAEDGEALTARAALDLRLNLPERALADAEAALMRRPDDAIALYVRGVARSRKGVAGAQDDLTAARRMDAHVGAKLPGLEAGS